jgi:hypothetical protein
MQFIGIDLHTNRFACRSLSDSGKEKTMAAFELDESDALRFFAALARDAAALIEAAVNTFAFAALFRPLVQEIIIAHTYQLKNSKMPCILQDLFKNQPGS